MDKIGMRDWVASLEGIIDNKLRKWKKENRIENGEAVQLRWQFEQTHVHMDIFWRDKQESITLKYIGPRASHEYLWHGLDDRTFNKICDRVGNLAQVTMYPPIDLLDIQD
jgi:hypothetical protein